MQKYCSQVHIMAAKLRIPEILGRQRYSIFESANLTQFVSQVKSIRKDVSETYESMSSQLLFDSWSAAMWFLEKMQKFAILQ